MGLLLIGLFWRVKPSSRFQWSLWRSTSCLVWSVDGSPLLSVAPPLGCNTNTGQPAESLHFQLLFLFRATSFHLSVFGLVSKSLFLSFLSAVWLCIHVFSAAHDPIDCRWRQMQRLQTEMNVNQCGALEEMHQGFSCHHQMTLLIYFSLLLYLNLYVRDFIAPLPSHYVWMDGRREPAVRRSTFLWMWDSWLLEGWRPRPEVMSFWVCRGASVQLILKNWKYCLYNVYDWERSAKQQGLHR